MSFTAIARELDRRGIRYPSRNRTTWNPWAIKNILTHPKYAGLNVYGRTSMRLYTPKVEVPQSEWTISSSTLEPLIDSSTYEKVQSVIASYTRNRTNQDLLDDLKSIVTTEGKLNSYLIKANRSTASLATYRTRFGSIGRALCEVGYQCHATEDWLKEYRSIRGIRAKLMHDIVLASAGRVRIDDRKNYRFRTCLRVKSSRQLVAVAVARCQKGHKESVRWRVRCLRNERNFVILLAQLNETNDSVLNLFVAPPLRNGKQVSLHRHDPRLAGVIRLTHLENFEAAVKTTSTRTEFMNWMWYEPSDAFATPDQLARIARVCKRALMRLGMNQKTLDRIRKGVPVRGSKLAQCLKVLQQCEAGKAPPVAEHCVITNVRQSRL